MTVGMEEKNTDHVVLDEHLGPDELLKAETTQAVSAQPRCVPTNGFFPTVVRQSLIHEPVTGFNGTLQLMDGAKTFGPDNRSRVV